VRPAPGMTGAGAWGACRPQRGTTAPACLRRDAGAVSCLAGRARRSAPGLGGRAGAPQRRLDDVVSSLRSFSATLLHVEHGRGVPDGVERGATRQTQRRSSDVSEKEKGVSMIHKIAAIVLFVHDLAGCTAFYRDTFKLPYQGSDADGASFLLGVSLGPADMGYSMSWRM